MITTLKIIKIIDFDTLATALRNPLFRLMGRLGRFLNSKMEGFRQSFYPLPLKKERKVKNRYLRERERKGKPINFRSVTEG